MTLRVTLYFYISISFYFDCMLRGHNYWPDLWHTYILLGTANHWYSAFSMTNKRFLRNPIILEIGDMFYSLSELQKVIYKDTLRKENLQPHFNDVNLILSLAFVWEERLYCRAALVLFSYPDDKCPLEEDIAFSYGEMCLTVRPYVRPVHKPLIASCLMCVSSLALTL